MNMEDVTRRNLFVAGGMGAFAAAAFAGAAQAKHDHKPTATEEANVRLVDEFCQTFNDGEKLVKSLADTAVVRMMEDKPAVVGPKATLDELKKLMGPQDKVEVITHHTFAKGPVVMNLRTDILKAPGKPDQSFKVVGVFIVKGGKIVEWTDYVET